MEPDNKSTNNNQVCNESRCVDGDEDKKIKLTTATKKK